MTETTGSILYSATEAGAIAVGAVLLALGLSAWLLKEWE